MGCGTSAVTKAEADARKATDAVDKAFEEDSNKEEERIKLLLLGAGESGKSTVFKQMRLMSSTGAYTRDELAAQTHVIFSNTIQAMKILVKQVPECGHVISPENEVAAEALASAGDSDIICLAAPSSSDKAAVPFILASHISQLWQDPGIKATYEKRAQFQLPDSCDYYFNKVEAIGHPTYVPSEEDYLKSRVRTSGIIENTFTIDKLEWIISDVGGQRNERRKWIHCFDKVNAVIFVASLSEYDQTLFEAEGKNRLQEALDLFSEIIRTKFLKNSSVILFLNKDDLFRKKIEKVDIRDVETHRFEDYTGGCNYDAGIAYIRDAFLKLVPKAPCQAHNTLGCSDSACKRLVREVRPFVTCATNKDNVKAIFGTVKDAILREKLNGSAHM